MQARRASRELALILFSQLDKNLEKYKSEDFADIILKSVRTLISSLYDEVSICASSLSELKNQIIEYENNHKDNLSRPIDATNIPVPMILTSEFEGKIDTLLNAADKAQSALEIAELSALANKVQTKAMRSEQPLCNTNRRKGAGARGVSPIACL